MSARLAADASRITCGTSLLAKGSRSKHCTWNTWYAQTIIISDYSPDDHPVTEHDTKDLHAARIEAVRDAGIQLQEMTSAALDWYRRPSRGGSRKYAIYLEARGLVSAPDAHAEESGQTVKGEPDGDVRSKRLQVDGKGTHADAAAKEGPSSQLGGEGGDKPGGNAQREWDMPERSESDLDDDPPDFLRPGRFHDDEHERPGKSEENRAVRGQMGSTTGTRRQVRARKRANRIVAEKQPAVSKHVVSASRHTNGSSCANPCCLSLLASRCSPYW